MNMEKHTYRVYKNKWTFFVFVCQRDHLTYEKGPETNLNYREVYMDISRQRFNELLEDMECEAQRSSYQCKAPVVSARTMKNPEKLRKIMALYNSHSIRILRKDVKKLV